MTPPVVVVGDSLLDVDVDGHVDRLCPDAPVPIVDVTAQRPRPGGAGLAALLAARAGHDVVLVTALGTDPEARQLADLLGAHVTVVRLPLRGTTVSKTRIRAAEQSLVRLDAGDGRAAPDPVDNAVRAALRGAGAVLVADYGRGVTANRSLRSVLAAAGGRVPLVWDPHPRGEVLVPGCLLATPNESEAAGDAAALRVRWGCDAVAMTVGARGAVLATADSAEVLPVPAVATGRDTCGAGDAFAAAAAGALLAGDGVRAAVATAVATASRFVAAGGVGSLGTTRRRVVATGGCFDLLHPGHLSLLHRARALGDELVVCLNSDASVRRRKGPDRPVVPESDRAALLRALDCVDRVVVFDEDDPTTVLDRLRPDVWVKGGDYTVADLPEADVVHRHGGRTVIVPLVGGWSTTGLVAAAGNRKEFV